ncbi:MAG TPA: DNA polymerase I [Thiobacillaceae bacterium]|nr:DNA polymerase I [Thiobacillaceae bacterium]
MSKILLLVDGSSYLYRAFHALPDLRTRDGFPTGALRGVIGMLQKLRREVPADSAACVFDAKGKTFRDALYPQYKAHRPPMPADLAAQIEPLHGAVRALGWPLLMVEGVEADDVIATLVRQAEAQGMRSVVSTGDKDLAQLVTPHVTLINTMTNETLDEAGVRAKFGVPPERIVDYLALVGDSVDNIPGVAKVGPKTAVKWLDTYGSLDGVMAHAGEIPGAIGDNLRQALDFLPLGRELVTVKTDVPLEIGLRDLHWQPEARDKLIELYRHFEFRSWLGELAAQDGAADPASPGADPAPDPGRDYAVILDEAGLQDWIERIGDAELVSIDTETTSLDPMRAALVGLSLSVRVGEAAYIPLAHHYAGAPAQLPLDGVLERLRSWLEDPERPKLGQNLKYDWQVFANHGIQLAGIAHDTLLQSYVLEAHKSHNMDELADRHLHLKTIPYEAVCGKGAAQIGFDQVEVARAGEYAAEDADITLRLHEALYPQVRAAAGLDYVYRRIELPLLPVLARMERRGVRLDAGLLRRHSDFLAREMMDLEQQAHAAAGQPFNLNSTKQLQEIFFNQLGLPVIKKTPKGAPSTDEEVLEKLALDFPLPRLILNYRGLAKLKSTYTDKLPGMVNPATGRVHTTYSQAVAVTGRLASQDPNLQNIPVRTPEGRKIREAFVAEPGFVIVSADYSQIELRIMAHLSGDQRLLQAFAEDRDIHTATAAEVLGLAPEQVAPEQRRMAKAVNFGLIYGMSAFGLAAQLGIERGTAQNFIDRYFARYPGVAEYMARTREQARMQGYVETLFGRRLYLPEIASGNPARRQGAERAAINAPMQGTAADLIKLAMLAVQGWLDAGRLESRMIMQVHDELVLEVREAELDRVMADLPRLMGGVADLKVPLRVETGAGPNWEAAH